MKKFLLICCMLLFLCSCTQGPVTEDNIPPNNSYEKDSASADAEEINITSMLSLQQDQSYVVCDYFEGNVLILISDSSKQNSNDITDQATTVFFEEFVHDYNEAGDEFLQEDLNNVLAKIIPDHVSKDQYVYPGEEHYKAVESWPNAVLSPPGR